MPILHGVDLLYRLGNTKQVIQYKIPHHPLRDQLYKLFDLYEILCDGNLRDQVVSTIENIKCVMGVYYVD